MEPAHEKLNWIPLPDPLTGEEVRIQITWTANARTELAIRRQAKTNGFATPTDYLLQALAAIIAGNEEDTILTDAGGFLCNRDGYGEDGMTPQNV
jgi:hypothetical protein